MVSPILPLKITGATVSKKGARLIGPINLELASEGLTIVIGPNGSGKTSLLRLVHGLERAGGGLLQWNAGADDVHKRQSFVFQTPVMMHRTAIENVAYPLIIRGTARKEASRLAADALEEIGLGFARERRATSLSGGEQQKLAIARALITKPEMLILDEPSANLDGKSVRDIEAILLRVAESGTRIIMATHDIAQAKRLADDIIFMYRGLIHETGKSEQVSLNPQTAETAAFLKGDILI